MEKEIVQNTKEWLLWRHQGIGASEAPIIMGVSRFKTPKELWEQKINPTPPENKQNFIHEKGHRLEDIARKNYELETFRDWKARLCVHQDEERFRASLDGFNAELNAVWECKYMGKDKYETLKDETKTKRERVPKEYWPQLMHQVMVTGCKEVHLTGIIDNKVNKNLEKSKTEQFNFKFAVDQECYEYIKNQLIPKLSSFLVWVDEKIEPRHSKDDVANVKDSELSKLLTKYKSTKLKVDKYTKEEKELKKKIFEISLKIHNKVNCKGHVISESISEDKKVPDYEKFATGLMSEEDLFAGGFFKITKGRKTQRITISKDK